MELENAKVFNKVDELIEKDGSDEGTIYLSKEEYDQYIYELKELNLYSISTGNWEFRQPGTNWKVVSNNSQKRYDLSYLYHLQSIIKLFLDCKVFKEDGLPIGIYVQLRKLSDMIDEEIELK